MATTTTTQWLLLAITPFVIILTAVGAFLLVRNFLNKLHYKRLQRAEQLFLAQLTPLAQITSVDTLPEFGRSVFAQDTIAAFSLVGVYPGKRISRQAFNEKLEYAPSARRYAQLLSADLVLDPSDNYGRLVDEADNRLAFVNEPPPGGEINLATLRTDDNIWFVSTRNIAAGEQLFTSYGPKYLRDYPSEMTATDGYVPFNDEASTELRKLVEKYPWLAQGIACFLAES